MIFDVTFHTLPALPIWFEVIIDWHDHNAEKHEKEATKFFREMAKEYGEFPNVIFEIYNEPIAQDWSQTIKPYHERIVKVIRKYSSNLIVLGTRTWSQDVDEAAQDPVQGENLAYTIHFYANTHMQDSWQTCCNSHSDLSSDLMNRSLPINTVSLFWEKFGFFVCSSRSFGTKSPRQSNLLPFLPRSGALVTPTGMVP